MEAIRRRLFRSIPDLAATVFLGVIIPVTYWFELFVVLPNIKFLRTPVLYYGHMIIGTLLMFNVVGNWIFVMMTGTSTKGVLMPIPKETGGDMQSRDKWRFCTVCEALQPPRSWHCKTCNACILKRDHHCFFTGCCIGHKNQRYFLVLITHLFIATTYATFYNNYFIWIIHAKDFRNGWTFVKMIFPLAWAMLDWSVVQFYFMVYMVNLVGSLFTGALLFYHLKNALKGELAHEANATKDMPKIDYNQGWKKNLVMIVGKSWLAAMVNPFARSELPHDGVHWETVARNKDN